jgi:hypothetical protein
MASSRSDPEGAPSEAIVPEAGERANAFHANNHRLTTAPTWRKFGEPLAYGVVAGGAVGAWLGMRSWGLEATIVASLLAGALVVATKGGWALGLHVFSPSTCDNPAVRKRSEVASWVIGSLWVVATLLLLALPMGRTRGWW